MNELMISNLPEYVPILEDLINVFPLLPPADKVKQDFIDIPVQDLPTHVKQITDSIRIEAHLRPIIVGKIRFIKMVDKGKPQWFYNGLLKYK